MAAAADDDVVVQRDAEESGGLGDLARRLDIGLRWGRVARWMIVRHDERRGAELDRPLDHLARIDRRVIDGAALLALVRDQCSLAIEEEEMEFLHRSESDRGGGV